ncbi:MAG: helix-turn-helix transcriptional regulator [Gammaproteobacteria bacterium]
MTATKKAPPYFLHASQELQNLTSILKKFGITYFTYLKKFPNGYHVNISSNPEWLEHYYKFELYASSIFDNLKQPDHQEFVIWPAHSSNLPVFTHAENHFNTGNGVTIVKKTPFFHEFYFFSGKVEDTNLMNFYFNNIDLLQRFTFYWKNKAEKLLTTAEKHKIFIPNKLDNPVWEDNLSNKSLIVNSELIQDFLEAIKTRGYTFQGHDFQKINFTSRELECALCLLRGFTVREIAHKLYRSQRTIEKHVDNIKNKLNCQHKSDLIRELIRCGAHVYLKRQT